MKRLTKSSTDNVLFGVCGGIATYMGISSLLVRLVFVFAPISLLVYLILGVLLPKEDSLLY